MSNKTWQDKAHRIIGILCYESFIKANTRKHGGLYKKHKPYSVPDIANELVVCLANDDEKTAKTIFMWTYPIK